MSAILAEGFVLLHAWGRCPEGAEGGLGAHLSCPLRPLRGHLPHKWVRKEAMSVFSGEHTS
ncbi:hypothetical protein SAMN04488568_11819 [Maricaulis salignorans]|uniref:Uncharacterized protein n=1 Tax=Maricaulis salignorans TaxID=144026 RepID=A0A1G9V7X3_9PROT|nr:hypothetical protein SAMN04488568_11819 [Maricaulis salignorans]